MIRYCVLGLEKLMTEIIRSSLNPAAVFYELLYWFWWF